MDDGRAEAIRRNLSEIRTQIARACAIAGRDPSQIQLVAAAKTVPPELIQVAVDAGVTSVGENHVRELRDARRSIPGVCWHYIGTLQTNTAHHVAELADVVHSLSGHRATRRLARRCAEAGRTIEGLIEIDFTGGRSGIPPAEAIGFADEVAALEGIDLIGLMTVPPIPAGAEDARRWFVRLRELCEVVRERHPQVLELSMGMSLDYAVAIEEGATMIRIGTALFGSRRRAEEHDPRRK
jgi:pyridoxal phosphate enzyme (YggS family)